MTGNAGTVMTQSEKWIIDRSVELTAVVLFFFVFFINFKLEQRRSEVLCRSEYYF